MSQSLRGPPGPAAGVRSPHVAPLDPRALMQSLPTPSVDLSLDRFALQGRPAAPARAGGAWSPTAIPSHSLAAQRRPSLGPAPVTQYRSVSELLGTDTAEARRRSPREAGGDSPVVSEHTEGTGPDERHDDLTAV